mgnify:CR=1 FL=1
MAGGKRSTAKREHWRQIVARQQASGLSVRGFCGQEGVRESAFYSWRCTLRDEASQSRPNATAAFVPAAISEASGEHWGEPIVIEFSAGPTLRLPGTTSTTWLAELIVRLNGRGAGVR